MPRFWFAALGAALIDILEDTLRIDHWYMDPKNHAAVEQIFAQITHRPASHFSWAFTKREFPARFVMSAIGTARPFSMSVVTPAFEA